MAVGPSADPPAGNCCNLKHPGRLWTLETRTPRYKAEPQHGRKRKEKKQSNQATPIPTQIKYSGNQPWYIINSSCLHERRMTQLSDSLNKLPLAACTFHPAPSRRSGIINLQRSAFPFAALIVKCFWKIFDVCLWENSWKREKWKNGGETETVI